MRWTPIAAASCRILRFVWGRDRPAIRMIGSSGACSSVQRNSNTSPPVATCCSTALPRGPSTRPTSNSSPSWQRRISRMCRARSSPCGRGRASSDSSKRIRFIAWIRQLLQPYRRRKRESRRPLLAAFRDAAGSYPGQDGKTNSKIMECQVAAEELTGNSLCSSRHPGTN